MKSKKPLKVFIGYDKKEDLNYRIAVYSIQKNTTYPCIICPIDQKILRRRGVYNRPVDEKASNDFSITRFLVPYLSLYKGLSLFMDCDQIITGDLGDLIEYGKSKEYAIHCVKHDYIPKESIKMDGKIQQAYPRKNWSSFVLYNSDHSLVRQMNPDLINKATPAFLHRYEFLPNETIGALPICWNFLVGEYNIPEDKNQVKNWHYTLGSPLFPGYENCPASDLWYQYKTEMENTSKKILRNSQASLMPLEDILKIIEKWKTIKGGGCGC